MIGTVHKLAGNGSYITWQRAAIIMGSVIMLGFTVMMNASLAWKNDVAAKIESKEDKADHAKDMDQMKAQMDRVEDKIDKINDAVLKIIGQHEAENIRNNRRASAPSARAVE